MTGERVEPGGTGPGDARVDDAGLGDRVRAWVEADPDPVTRAELLALLQRGDTAELADRFAGPLAFGTAGLRGPLRAGPNGMNRAVVRRTAAALARWLDDRSVAGAVVVGYDARHGSADFAADTGRVVTATGRRALLLPRPLPTPVLAFAVARLQAAAGVMVTASHNPPGDNGLKVYLGDGAQIVPPVDAEIAERIADAPPAGAIPLGPSGEVVAEDLVMAYVDAVTEVAGALSPTGPREVTVAYTPLHGVGHDLLLRAFAAMGLAPPRVVAVQADPDPDFPTVAVPNPEEPGTLDRVLALAAAEGTDLVIAHDPDADRVALAAPAADGSWRVLTGDETGCLLADLVLRRTTGADRVVATTVVSSRLLERVAAAYDVRWVETLTGFKWLVRAGPGRLVYAYEEALGVAVGGSDGLVVRDKDGIGAALAAALLAAQARADGRTLLDLLADLDRRFGRHRTTQVSVRVPDPAQVVARLRRHPPPVLGDRRVESVVDLALPGGRLPPTDGVVLRLAHQGRLVVRPSGTEPKVKAYLELVDRVEDLNGLREAVEALLTGPG